MERQNILLSLATICTGLMAGLFFSWSCSVVPGLAKVTDCNYLAAMQSINREIQNAYFFSCFFGALVLLVISTFMAWQPGHHDFRFWCLLAATLIYAFGVVGLTIAGNVPLNDLLENFDLKNASPESMAAMRLKFESPWNNFNLIRAIGAVVSFVLALLSCLGAPGR